MGWIVSLVAWELHVGALSLAALSTVRAVLAGGLVFLAVLAERFFGFRLERRQWTGVAITAAGLAVIGLTAKTEGPQRWAARSEPAAALKECEEEQQGQQFRSEPERDEGAPVLNVTGEPAEVLAEEAGDEGER